MYNSQLVVEFYNSLWTIGYHFDATRHDRHAPTETLWYTFEVVYNPAGTGSGRDLSQDSGVLQAELRNLDAWIQFERHGQDHNLYPVVNFEGIWRITNPIPQQATPVHPNPWSAWPSAREQGPWLWCQGVWISCFSPFFFFSGAAAVWMGVNLTQPYDPRIGVFSDWPVATRQTPSSPPLASLPYEGG
ncbi:hypothetical protein QBC45DRAFT_431001 [Copromyces sp. CBS 386.78]|nr:hypothetical protein QBC45DRAFT_431001 [Copromyces sp. CBS 386.78]